MEEAVCDLQCTVRFVSAIVSDNVDMGSAETVHVIHLFTLGKVCMCECVGGRWRENL